MLTLSNLRIWDGVSDSYDSADTLQIGGSRITRVGAAAGLPPGRDMSGLTAIPGLMDSHVHLCLDPGVMAPEDQQTDPDKVLPLMRERAIAMVKAGITTARDLGGGHWTELALRDEINAGSTIGPRLLCAGQPITSVGGHCHFWGGEAADIAAVDAVLDAQVEKGADLIKVMATGGSITKNSVPANTQFDADTLARIVARSRAAGKTVAAHCHGTGGISNAARAGVTTIEHCSWVGPDGWGKNYDPDAVAMMVEQGTWVSPTIHLGWRRFRGNAPLESLRQQNLAAIQAAGVRLIAGTDAGIPNVRHHELPLALVEMAHFAGLSPVATLRAATSDCALAFGLGAETGRLAPGFSADILLFEGDPLGDLAVLAKPVEVITRGRPLLGVL